MVLHGKNLVNFLREACDNAKSRIWIIVPFIGTWNNVQRILGNSWLTNIKIDLRLLTDIENEEFIDFGTFQKFRHRAETKSLDGLHAKLYIIDDTVLLTSANLTGTAFSKRHEIGIVISVTQDLEKIIQDWWEKAEPIDSSWFPKSRKNNDDTGGHKLKKHCDLPNLPETLITFKDYDVYLKAYRHFKKIYEENVSCVLTRFPIYLEIDAFLNYLFHEHDNKPTNTFSANPYRILSDRQRISELKRYHQQFASWINEIPNREDYRLANIELVQNLLSPHQINKLTRDNLKLLTKCFHCMNSMPINRAKFINSNNNSLDTIIEKWNNLLHETVPNVEYRMENTKMIGCGKSAIRELLSLYYPNDYPVINSNSNSGLKFFGYDLKTY